MCCPIGNNQTLMNSSIFREHVTERMLLVSQTEEMVERFGTLEIIDDVSHSIEPLDVETIVEEDG